MFSVDHPSQVDGIDDCSLHFDEDLTIMWLSNDAGGLSQDQCGVKLSKDFDRKVSEVVGDMGNVCGTYFVHQHQKPNLLC